MASHKRPGLILLSDCFEFSNAVSNIFIAPKAIIIVKPQKES